MKKVILYARVSTDRQAEQGFGREEQVAQLRDYCKKMGYEIVKEYLEDFSAKNFNRPAFKQILSDIKNKRVIANILLVPKIDRFTRNLADTFEVIAELDKYKMKVFSLAEGEMDFNNPHKFFPLIIQTGAAQYDNMIRSDNTKRGMRQAMKNGKCVYTPPKGYVNNKITKLIEIDEPVAAIVKWAFCEYSKGIYSAEEVRRQLEQRGLKIAKQCFLDMLKNPIYIGKILVPANNDEPEELVEGLHKPIIDEETFYIVQKVLKGKQKPYKQPKDDIKNALPLRGHLICPECGRVLTGSTPKGNGGKYPYYHCQQTKYGCNHRISAKNAHNIMEDYLKTFHPTDEVIELFTKVLVDIFNTNDNEGISQADKLDNEAKHIDEQKEKIQDDYLNNRILPEQYTALTKSLNDKQNEIAIKHITLPKVPANFENYISYSCGLVQNLSNYYTKSLPTTQNKLIGLIFPEKLVFTGIEYKTNKMNEVFALICSMNKGVKETSPAKVARLYAEAPPIRLERMTL